MGNRKISSAFWCNWLDLETVLGSGPVMPRNLPGHCNRLWEIWWEYCQCWSGSFFFLNKDLKLPIPSSVCIVISLRRLVEFVPIQIFFLGSLKLGQFSINELQTLRICRRRQLGNICNKYSWCWGGLSNLIIVQGLAALLMRHWPGSSNSPFCHYLT